MVLEQKYKGGGIMIQGYEGFKLQWLSAQYFSKNNPNSFYRQLSSGAPWHVRHNYNFYMHDGSEEHKWLSNIAPHRRGPTFTDLDSIKQKLYVPSPGDTLFFDKACTIPRIKCEGTWKRSVKITKANTVVIPDNTPSVYIFKVALFLDTASRTISIFQYLDNCEVQPVVGQRFNEWHELSKDFISSGSLNSPSNQEIVEELSGSVCIFVGELFAYKQRDQWLFDVFNGIYPRITQESTLLQLLGNEEEKFTPDFIESITELLNSIDRDAVHQGMRILAHMDYIHYPSITKYILQKTKHNWGLHKPYNSAVKFMLSLLGQYDNPFTNVTPEEFPIVHDILIEIIRSKIDQQIEVAKVKTNLTVNVDYNLELRLPEEASSNTITEETKDDSELA